MENQAQEMDTGNTMVVALDNLENAAAQKNDTVKRLVISNTSLYASLVARDRKISRLCTVITNLSTGGGGGVGGGGIRNNGKATSAPWDPMGYCWSYGFKVCVGHCSASCEKSKDRHDAHLTVNRGNIQGECEWNKNWKPRGN